MTETESVPQLSQFSPESRRLQAALLLTYAAAGISAALLLRLSASGQPMPMRGSLLTACVLFGVAVRTAVDASVNRLLGTIASWAGSLLLIAAADLAIGFSPLPTTGTVAALVLGFGYIPPWSTADRWVNAELGYRFRWRAQRLFVMAWSGGLTFGCLIAMSENSAIVTIAVVVALAATGLVLSCRRLPEHTAAVSPEPYARSHAVRGRRRTKPLFLSLRSLVPRKPTTLGMRGAVLKNLFPARRHRIRKARQQILMRNVAAEQQRPVRPMPFIIGNLIAATGLTACWGTLAVFCDLSSADAAVSHGVILSIGLTIGHGLLFSAAPATGYVFAVLPFLILFLPITAAQVFVNHIAETAEPTASVGTFFVSVLRPLLQGLLGVCAGAVSCGCLQIIGEQLQDSPHAPNRSRVFWTGTFLAAAAVLLLGLAVHLIPPKSAVIVLLLIPAAGLPAFQRIPSPTPSGSGSDVTDAETENELQDVMAVVRRK